MFNLKMFEELSEYFESKYGRDAIGEAAYEVVGRYVSIIKTSIENIDAIYINIDKEDPETISDLQAYADILRDHIDLKINMLIPRNTMDGLMLYGEMKKILGYTHKILITLIERNLESSIDPKLIEMYKSFVKIRTDQYVDIRAKELEAKIQEEIDNDDFKKIEGINKIESEMQNETI